MPHPFQPLQQVTRNFAFMVPPESAQQATCLANLPYDILYIICDRLAHVQSVPIITVARFETHIGEGFGHLKRPKAALIALSMTCKQLRRICGPLVFRASRLDVKADATCLPPHVIQFTRRLYIDGVRMDAEEFRGAVKSLPHLREAYVSQSGIFLSALLEHPTLEVLSVRDVEDATLDAPLGTISAPLRVLRMCFPRRLWPPYWHAKEIFHETQWLRTVLHQVRPTLEELFIPGESTDIAFLAAQPWPCLRELVIFGECPELTARTLLALLGMLPRLHAFTFAPVHASDRRPVLIWPPGPTPSSHSDLDISGLRRLSISSPSADDDIFAHLPRELTELALRDFPRFYNRRRLPPAGSRGPFYHGVLSCSAALRIFRKLRAPDLGCLELVVVEDACELEMLACIAASCPKLASLELHRYRDAANRDAVFHAPPTISVTRLAEALTAFKSLRTLRLHFEFPKSELQIDGSNPSFEHAEELMEGVARTVVRHLPWLQTVCTLGWCFASSIRGWKMWAIGERDGAPTFDPVTFFLVDI